MAALFPSAAEFPEYSPSPKLHSVQLATHEGGNSNSTDLSWLHNLSFIPQPEADGEVSDSSSSDYGVAPDPRKKKVRLLAPKTREAGDGGEKDVYRIDRLPDMENLRYESVYSGNLAVYRRKFDCLGLRPSQQLKWTDGRSKLNRKKRRLEVDGRYFKELVKVNQNPGELAIPGKSESAGVSDFIKINTNSSALVGEKSSESLTAEYHMSRLAGEYNRSLLDEPHNVSLWLEFLAFQDQLLEWGNLSGEGANAGHKMRALRERKITIFERALEQNPTSEELLIGHMALVQQLWPTEKIIRKWKDIVFVHPNKPRLWLCYIQFCQTNFSSFGTSSLISLYKKCIVMLSSIYHGTLKSHLPLPNTASYLLAIFSLFCQFLRQIGLTERAVASYQALVEFNLCAPPEFSSGDKSLKEFFETFWDSGCLRYGEAGALGWRGWMKKHTSGSSDVAAMGVVPESVFSKAVKEEERTDTEDRDAEFISGLSPTDAWLKLEEHRMTQNCLPWQPDSSQGQTEEDCSDPDRMVTYDDISQTLFWISDADLKTKLVLSFLNFLGAPVGSPFQSLVSTTTSLESLPDICTPPLLRTMEESASVGFTTCGLGTTCFLSAEKSLTDFSDSFTSQVFSEVFVPVSPTRTPSACNFVSNVCNHSLSLLPSAEHQTQIAKVWVSFLYQQLSSCSSQPSTAKKEIKSEIRSVHKLFKSLLRLEKHRNNLSLWNSFSLFEYSVGNFQEAKSLYQSLLARYPVPSATLCCTICECFMGMRQCLWEGVELDTPLCLHAIVGLAEGKNCPVTDAISPGRILKARSCFGHMAASSPCGDWEEIGKAVCSGYFEYLTRGVKEACAEFGKWVDRLQHLLGSEPDETKSELMLYYLKELFWKQLQLVEHHSVCHPVQPALLRGVVEKALEAFPDEGRFMAAFVRSERQTFISGRMRRYFDRIAPTADSALPWLFAVAAELDRYQRVRRQLGAKVEETTTGTMYRVTSLLARATAADNARHCPLLWRVYLVLLVFLDPKKVSAVFYQAVHSCPWFKVLYIDGVKFMSSEVDKIMELLEEKEMRLCVPFEEVKLLL